MGQPFYFSDDEETECKSAQRLDTEGIRDRDISTVSANLGRNMIAAFFQPDVQEYLPRDNRQGVDDSISADMLDVLQGLMYDFGGTQASHYYNNHFMEVGDTNSESSDEGVVRRRYNRVEYLISRSLRQQSGNNNINSNQNGNSNQNSNNNGSTTINPLAHLAPAFRRAQEVGESRLQTRLQSLWRHSTAPRETLNERFRRDRGGPYARISRHSSQFQRRVARGRFQEPIEILQPQVGAPSTQDTQPESQPPTAIQQPYPMAPPYRRQRRRFGFSIAQS